jgi:hypothetical protein
LTVKGVHSSRVCRPTSAENKDLARTIAASAAFQFGAPSAQGWRTEVVFDDHDGPGGIVIGDLATREEAAERAMASVDNWPRVDP